VAQFVFELAVNAVWAVANVCPVRAVPEQVIERALIGREEPPVPVMFAGDAIATDPEPVPMVVIKVPVTVMLPPSEAKNWLVLSCTFAQVKAVPDRVRFADAILLTVMTIVVF